MVLRTVYATSSHKEAQRGVSIALCACDMKMFVSGFIAKRLLNNSSFDIRKQCLISEVPSQLDTCTGFRKHSITVQSLTYPTEKQVETVGTAVTFRECDVNGGSPRFS
jgi:hypothetical protein